MKRKFAAKAFSNWIYGWLRNTIRHPKYRWWIVAGSLVYLLNPFDLAPDALPVVGWIDDGLLATIVVTEVSQMMSDRRKAQNNKKTVEVSKEATVDVKAMSLS
ncbi:MAG: DUF1232 domain-containing protein [Oscillatoriales cyanobacterium C42_A2020_001]|nr:DUF1232 domain-containing protein [Leptolyngbyaceae cyanobacterium C42_A2020_001]